MAYATDESYTIERTTVTGAPCSENVLGMPRVTTYTPSHTWSFVSLPPLTDAERQVLDACRIHAESVPRAECQYDIPLPPLTTANVHAHLEPSSPRAWEPPPDRKGWRKVKQ